VPSWLSLSNPLKERHPWESLSPICSSVTTVGLDLAKHVFQVHSAKEPGNMRFVVAQQTGRPNHFTVSEIWADAHRAAAQTRHFRDMLGPMLGALYDQRIYRAVE